MDESGASVGPRRTRSRTWVLLLAGLGGWAAARVLGAIWGPVGQALFLGAVALVTLVAMFAYSAMRARPQNRSD